MNNLFTHPYKYDKITSPNTPVGIVVQSNNELPDQWTDFQIVMKNGDGGYYQLALNGDVELKITNFQIYTTSSPSNTGTVASIYSPQFVNPISNQPPVFIWPCTSDYKFNGNYNVTFKTHINGFLQLQILDTITGSQISNFLYAVIHFSYRKIATLK